MFIFSMVGRGEGARAGPREGVEEEISAKVPLVAFSADDAFIGEMVRST